MAGINADDRLLAQLQAVGKRHAPVGYVHRVERRLEQLVFEQHALIGTKPRIHLGQGRE